MARGPQRLVGIDVLRAAAIAGVLANHLREALFWSPPQSAVAHAAWKLAGVGNYGVVLFFAISGFVIAGTIIRRDGTLAQMRIGAFYRRRVARIGPALAFSLAIGALALLIASRTPPANLAIIFGNAAFTPVFWLSIATFTFNYLRFHAVLFSGQDWGAHWGVLWSLSVEEQFYLLFPLLARRVAATPARLFAALALCVVAGVGSRWMLARSTAPGVWPMLTPHYLDILGLGVAAAALPRVAIARQWAMRGASLGLAVMILAPVPQSRIASPILVALGAVLVMLSCQNGAVFTGLIWRPLARIGRVSYGMYLFHYLVLWPLIPVLHGMAFLPALAVFVAAVTLAAEVSFRIVEQPAARWVLNRWSALRREPRSVPSAPIEELVPAQTTSSSWVISRLGRGG
jgi:peptidoglycan/LPS O-acetylase OafA/YrhL